MPAGGAGRNDEPQCRVSRLLQHPAGLKRINANGETIERAMDARTFVQAERLIQQAAGTPISDPLDVMARARARSGPGGAGGFFERAVISFLISNLLKFLVQIFQKIFSKGASGACFFLFSSFYTLKNILETNVLRKN